MILGAVCEREMRTAPRSQGLFVARAVYAGVLVAIVATCWLVVTGSQSVATLGDSSRFAATLLRILGPLQLALAVLAAALAAALSVSVEKDRRTLELLLVSRLGDAQLVVGKLVGSLVRVLFLLASAVPVFALVALFGGVTAAQLGRMFAVTLAAALAAASIANAVAFWKDTTFQTLAITAAVLVAWLAAGEAVAARYGPEAAAAVSPARGIFAALEPDSRGFLPGLLAVCGGVILVTNAVAVPLARRWNTGGEPRRAAVRAAATHRPPRRVWDNPVLMAARCPSCGWPGGRSSPRRWRASCRRPGRPVPTGSAWLWPSCRWPWRACSPWPPWR
jgi:hypothetical protein